MLDLIWPLEDRAFTLFRQRLTLGVEHVAIATRPETRKIKRANGVVTVPIMGGIVQRCDPCWESMGFFASSERISRTMRAIEVDKSVDTVVLNIDSPGGGLYGLQEAVDAIYQLRQSKQVIAIANSMACSAAYAIGSAASVFVAAPGADVGSVGVYVMHVSYADALAKDGVAVTFVKAPEGKADGNPFEALSEDARKHIQASVDQAYDWLVSTIARNRGVSAKVVRETYGQGRVVGAQDALAAGMIDRVDTLHAVFGKLGGAAKGGPSAEVLRARLQTTRVRDSRRSDG